MAAAVVPSSDSLHFSISAASATTAPQLTMDLTNPSATQRVSFKLKTTKPRRYLVKPNSGLIDTRSNVRITITVQERDVQQLLDDPHLADSDKFLVQSGAVDDSFYDTVTAAPVAEQATMLADLWRRPPFSDSKKLSNKKLRCSFTVEDAGDSAAAAAAEAPAASGEDAAEQIRERIAAPAPAAATAAAAPAAAAASPAPAAAAKAAPASAPSPAKASPAKASPAPAAAGAAADVAAAAAAGAASTPGAAADDAASLSELMTLRKKYDDLVLFSVQLSSSRDQLVKALDEARAEARQARLGSSGGVAAGGDGVARKRGGAADSSASADGSADAGGDAAQPEQLRFGLFQLLMVALVFFFLGRSLS